MGADLGGGALDNFRGLERTFLSLFLNSNIQLSLILEVNMGR